MDNTRIKLNTDGDTIGTDDIESVKYQRIKIIHGNDGVNDGDVSSSNPLPTKNASLTTWVSGTLTLTNADTAYKIPSSEQAGRRLLVLYNGSDTDMKIGSSSITTTGILLAAGATMAISAGANLYAVCASAGKVLTYMEGK